MARATFSNNVLQTAGADLSDRNNFLVQLSMDYLYITWFVHIASIVTLKAFWLYCLLPVFAIIKTVSVVRSFSSGKNFAGASFTSSNAYAKSKKAHA